MLRLYVVPNDVGALLRNVEIIVEAKRLKDVTADNGLEQFVGVEPCIKTVVEIRLDKGYDNVYFVCEVGHIDVR